MSGTAAWTILGVLALEAGLVVAVAALVARRVSSALWQRTIWQACFVALLGLLALEVTGGARAIAVFGARDSGRKLQSPVIAPAKAVSSPGEIADPSVELEPVPHGTTLASHSTDSPLSPSVSPAPSAGEDSPIQSFARGTPEHGGARLPPSRDQTGSLGSAGGHYQVQGERAVQGFDARINPADSFPATGPARRTDLSLLRGFVFVWLIGALVFLGLNVLARLRFAVLLRRRREVTDPAQLRRVEALAGQLGMTRHVRLFESSRLLGPVACGILRPAIGLPPRFNRDHTPAEQDAMLAHEAAHLAARDPAWYLLADALGGLLWWHPFVWWAKRRLHGASEAAADEASLLVRDGPGVLAESLVALGARLERPRPAAWLGIEGTGFRSGLARRVERLLKLSGRQWAPPGRARAALVRTLFPAALVMAVILCTAWTVPETSTPGENMKHPHWKRSFSLLAVVSALTAVQDPATAADAPKSTLAKTRPAELPPPPVVATAGARPRAAADLQAKLESIVLDEIMYDGLPLGQVIQSVMKDAAARDPEKVGVNFLFGQPAEPIRATPAIDPATGLPATAGAVQDIDLSATTIRIVPALKKVRLVDALDAIVRVADRPIKYTVEGYAVVLALDGERINALNVGIFAPPPPPALQTRAFKVDTNTFFSSLQNMFGHSIQHPADGREVGEVLRQLILPKLGVKLAGDSFVLYNPLTGMLLVRAPQGDFVNLQAAVEALGGSAGVPAEANRAGHGVLGGLPVSPRQ